MKISKCFFTKIICLVLALSLSGVLCVFADGQNTGADILDGMNVIAEYNFDNDIDGAALGETNFGKNWNVTLGDEATGVVVGGANGNYLQLNKHSSIELKNMYFGPSEAYAVSYRGKAAAKAHSYLFVRGTQVLKRNDTTMNWYEADGSGAGSGVGGSGISFRTYSDYQIQVSVKSYNAEKKNHVNTQAVLLSVYPEGEGTLLQEMHTYTCYDNGAGLIDFYIDGVKKASVTYSDITKYTEDNFETASASTDNPIHAEYYSNVSVFDASGENKLTVSNALVAVQGRVAFGNRNVVNACYDDIKVYAADLKINLANATKYGNGNLGILTNNESTKRCFPTTDTFVYFRNSGGMAASIGDVDLSKYDSVSITWWDAAYGKARTLTPGSINFAITTTGALDTTDVKQVEQEGVNKIVYWSLDENKEVGAKDDFRTAETITLSLDSDYNGPLYIAYMGATNAVAVSQITFHTKVQQAPTEEPTPTPTEEPTPTPTEEPTPTPTQTPGENPDTGDNGTFFAVVIILAMVAAGAVTIVRYKKESY